MSRVALGELMPGGRRSIDPRKLPDEEFELLSIPAFDAGSPERILGAQIGSTKQIVEPGDVLLSKIVPHIRRAWVVPDSGHRRSIGSSEWIVFRHRDADPRYLSHLLVSDHFNQAFMRTVAGVGGSLLRARPAQVAKIEIPLPPLGGQRRIAAILDKADELRTKRRAALTQLDTLTQAIFIDMFGDPVTNPKRLRVVALSELGTLDRGISKHRPRNASELLGGPYPLVQTGDVANSGGRVTSFSSTYSELGLRQSKLWPAGTLCITIAANIAKTGILTFEACFPDSVVGFNAASAGTSEYVQTVLSFHQRRLEALAPESAQKNINLKVLRNLQVPDPGAAEVARFKSACDSVLAQRRSHLDAVDLCDRLFASLQSRAFRGEL